MITPSFWRLWKVSLGNEVEANKAAWRNIGTPKSKLKHLITINSLNAVIITSWWYCMYKKHAQCAISSADVCHLQPLNIHTVLVLFAFLWGTAAVVFFLWYFGCWELWFFGESKKKRRREIGENLEEESQQKHQGSKHLINETICELLPRLQLAACALLKPHYVIHGWEIIWPRGEFNEISTTIHLHPNPHSISPNHFNILGKTQHIPFFVVQIDLMFLL